jgi:hypothetical protein
MWRWNITGFRKRRAFSFRDQAAVDAPTSVRIEYSTTEIRVHIQSVNQQSSGGNPAQHFGEIAVWLDSRLKHAVMTLWGYVHLVLWTCTEHHRVEVRLTYFRIIHCELLRYLDVGTLGFNSSISGNL